MAHADRGEAREYARKWRAERKEAGLKSPSEAAEKRRAYYQANHARIRAQQKEYWALNKDKKAEIDREYRRQNQSKISAQNRRYNYGLTEDAFNAMIIAQDFCCPVCDRQLNLKGYRTIHVDHDHDTGKVRGVLCRNCNVGIGHLREDAAIMLRAIAYLERHNTS